MSHPFNRDTVCIIIIIWLPHLPEGHTQPYSTHPSSSSSLSSFPVSLCPSLSLPLSLSEAFNSLHFLCNYRYVVPDCCSHGLTWIYLARPPLSTLSSRTQHTQAAIKHSSIQTLRQCSDTLTLHPEQLMSTKSRLQCRCPTGLVQRTSGHTQTQEGRERERDPPLATLTWQG